MKPDREQARDLEQGIYQANNINRTGIDLALHALQSAYAAGLADGKPKWLPMDDAPLDKTIVMRRATYSDGRLDLKFIRWDSKRNAIYCGKERILSHEGDMWMPLPDGEV